MSNTQFAFIKKSRLPSRESLQASIDSLGYDLKLDPDLDLLKDSGFSPCVLNGVPDVGFELCTESIGDVVGNDKELQAIANDNDFCIGMIWHGSMKDCACVMIVSCALARDFGAVISYEGNLPDSLDKLIEETHGVIAEGDE